MMYRSGKRYVAFCIELALIREGDNPIELFNRMNKIAKTYVNNVLKNKLGDDLLNQELPGSYMKLYEVFNKENKAKKTKEQPIPTRAQSWTNILCQPILKRGLATV